MDDFSWGATRVVQGDKTQGGHGDADGKFDPSDITMKRWADFERERRQISGTHSRGSTYDVVQRTGSPAIAGSTRNSVVSSETHPSNPSANWNEASLDRESVLSGATSRRQESLDQDHARAVAGSARARLESVPLLELSTSLASKASGKPRSTPPGSVTVARPHKSFPVGPSYQHSFASPQMRYGDRYDQSLSVRGDQDEEKRPMMSSGAGSPDPENSIPFAIPSPHPPRPTSEQWLTTRGVSLVDEGPVASSGGVEQITRGARRMSAQPPISPLSTGHTRKG